MYYNEKFWLYTAVEMARLTATPFRSLIQIGSDYNNKFNPMREGQVGRTVASNLEVWDRLTKRYPRPKFNITEVLTKDKTLYQIDQKIIVKKPFCNLLHFEKKNFPGPQKKLLIVAPLSGHYSTLLRGTVQDSLPYFDVYVTDWLNSKDISLLAGSFDLDDFINYVIDFTTHLGDNINIMAVCQPTVPVLAAVSIMAKEKAPTRINSMILTGGPIDARISPTKVNDFATTRDLHWFENNVITRVPANYGGFMRSVYPGFIQLAGFMSMNMQRHVGELFKLYQHLITGDEDSAEAVSKFYDEYLSVMDIPAEFYLQTIRTVFKDFSLPQGKMVSRGRLVDPSAIKNTALLVVEGEKDDISGIGQTKAALDLCLNIPKEVAYYHLQAGAGHYGVFNGSKFRNHIAPVIDEFTSKAENYFSKKRKVSK